MRLAKWLRTLPRHTLPVMTLTWVWQAASFYLPKLLVDGKPHYDLSVALDRLIPLWPPLVIVYLAAFLSWPVCYLCCAAQEKERAYRFLCAEFLAKAVCLAFFLLLPTATVRPAVTGDSLCELLVRFVYWFDSPTNLFPSVHCLMSWMCYLGVRDMPGASRGVKQGLLAFAVAVFASTLATKQHYVVDVFGGVAVAQLCWYAAGAADVRRAYTAAADRVVDACYACLPRRAAAKK